MRTRRPAARSPPGRPRTPAENPSGAGASSVAGSAPGPPRRGVRSAWIGSRNGASESRSTTSPQIPVGRSGRRSSASPRMTSPSGTGCSRQIVASSPRTACARRTGSLQQPGSLSIACAPGSGRTRSTSTPEVVESRQPVGGAKSLGCGGRSTESAAPRIVLTPRAASTSTELWSKASPGGRATVGSGRSSRSRSNVSSPSRHCSSRCVRRPADKQRRESRSRERHRVHAHTRARDDRRGAGPGSQPRCEGRRRSPRGPVPSLRS